MSDVVSKQGRQACWDARDNYWKCLDDNQQLKDKCLTQRKEYEKNCSKTWITYFDRRREYLKFRNVIDSGDKSMIEEFVKGESKQKKEK